ncbi:type VI immunity family protein [Burkholderia cepacia]|uniref:type VI immunity family protein n=1 Tax=Burkholderia cepacia TaxID=292 RepID=UPI002AB789E3|nr:type VI immunity family protein [Burkholderia cepacia]
MDKNFINWAKANQDQALIPNGVLEPRYSTGGIGAAFVVRAVLYFERAYAPEVRAAIAQCYEEYSASVDNKLTFVWHNGKAAQPLKKVKPFADLAAASSADDRFDFDYVSGTSATDASLYRFSVVGLRQRQEKAGNRGYNALSFSWPVVAVQENPDAFVKLFYDAARHVDAIHGHAGYAVNLSLTAVNENEPIEYWISRMMPGLDVGAPGDLGTRQLKGQIKTVDWLTAIDRAMLEAVGGLRTIRSELPPDWFAIGDYGTGVVIRAGVLPETGASETEGGPPVLPAAYVVLNHALRAVRANSLDALQHGTVNGGAPTYNTTISTAEWLKRFDVSADNLLQAKAAVLSTPRLDSENAVPAKI